MEKRRSICVYTAQKQGEELHEVVTDENDATGATSSWGPAKYRGLHKKKSYSRVVYTFFGDLLEEMRKVMQGWFSSRSRTPDKLVIKIPRDNMEEE